MPQPLLVLDPLGCGEGDDRSTIAVILELNPLLGLVVLLSLWGNILLSGFAGAFIPTLLDRIGVDPAVASSVFLTTLTDLFGFFLLLGLASALLL